MSKSLILDVHPVFEMAILLHRDSKISEMAVEAAGCSGWTYLDVLTGELLLCDGSDLVLWRGQLGVQP